MTFLPFRGPYVRLASCQIYYPLEIKILSLSLLLYCFFLSSYLDFTTRQVYFSQPSQSKGVAKVGDPLREKKHLITRKLNLARPTCDLSCIKICISKKRSNQYFLRLWSPSRAYCLFLLSLETTNILSLWVSVIS